MVLVAAVCGVFSLPGAARAQDRPLATQDPQPVGAGRVLVEGGFEYGTDVLFPVSGLTGNLLHVPMIGLVVGVSSIADVEFSGGPYKRLAIASRQPAPHADLVPAGDTTASVEDRVVSTKIRVLGESPSRPAVAVRFATRLPNGSESTGLALDTMDFYASLLLAKSVRSLRVTANIGLGILADPEAAARQEDVLTYGLSFVQGVGGGFDVVAEANGRVNTGAHTPPLGTESMGACRVGGRYRLGDARLDGGLIVGLTPRDPSLGFTVGFTYVFKAFGVG
ncbi:MAG: hypothetical protein EHM24_15935 [Acidobacteria bacterium]|nr:MAG: hypothetical protein EHM24_15935 [Acidobacteriota bacterium]